MFVKKIEIERPHDTPVLRRSAVQPFSLFTAIVLITFVTLLVCDAMGVHVLDEYTAPLMQPE